MNKDARPLYRKFEVRRTDGSDRPGGKHAGCSYFVLDLDHDEHAIAAIAAYAESCEDTRPVLARDLRLWLSSKECKHDDVELCEHKARHEIIRRKCHGEPVPGRYGTGGGEV